MENLDVVREGGREGGREGEPHLCCVRGNRKQVGSGGLESSGLLYPPVIMATERLRLEVSTGQYTDWVMTDTRIVSHLNFKSD